MVSYPYVGYGNSITLANGAGKQAGDLWKATYENTRADRSRRGLSFFDNLIYPARRFRLRRHQPTVTPRAPSRDQTIRVEGSGMTFSW